MFLLGIEKIAFGLLYMKYGYMYPVSILFTVERELISKGLKIQHTLTGYFKWFIS